MKNARLVLVMTAFLLLPVTSALFAQTAQKAPVKQEGIKLALGGDLYLSPQIWSDIGAKDDTKFGIGLGMGMGMGIRIDESKFLIGPHIGLSRWSADYSQKTNSATESVYVEMADVGLQVTVDFGDMFVSFGKGTSEISSGYVVNGKDIKYNYDGNTYPYSSVALGFKSSGFILGFGCTSYSGYAKHCNRAEFLLGLGI